MPPESFTPPDWVPLLVEAWRPLLTQLDEAMAESVRPDTPIAKLRETTACVLSRLDYSLEHLNSLISRDFATMLQLPDALVIARATGKFEAMLESLASILREVRRLNACGDDLLSKALLTEVVLHTLREIRDWLSRFLEALSDLRTTLEKNSQPLEGMAELEFNLKLTPAPQLGRLLESLRQQAGLDFEIEASPPVLKTGDPATLGFPAKHKVTPRRSLPHVKPPALISWSDWIFIALIGTAAVAFLPGWALFLLGMCVIFYVATRIFIEVVSWLFR